MMLTLMLTSKGVAAVPRASLVILSGALTMFGLPLQVVAVLLGVDALIGHGAHGREPPRQLPGDRRDGAVGGRVPGQSRRARRHERIDGAVPGERPHVRRISLVAAAGSGPGLIVVQEWWGLVDHIKTLADRFAAEGFVALAPDLYHGERTTSPDQAGKLLMALNIAGRERTCAAPRCTCGRSGAVKPKKVGDPRVLHGRPARAVRGAGVSGRDRRGGGLLRHSPEGGDRAGEGEGAGAGALRDARQGHAARCRARAGRRREEGRRQLRRARVRGRSRVLQRHATAGLRCAGGDARVLADASFLRKVLA